MEFYLYVGIYHQIESGGPSLAEGGWYAGIEPPTRSVTPVPDSAFGCTFLG